MAGVGDAAVTTGVVARGQHEMTCSAVAAKTLSAGCGRLAASESWVWIVMESLARVAVTSQWWASAGSMTFRWGSE